MSDEPAEMSFEQSPEMPDKSETSGSHVVIQSFKEFKTQHHEFYFKAWSGLERPCPAFKHEIVYASRSGWEHITDDRRSINEIKTRLLLLPYAKRLLEISTLYQDFHKTEDGIRYWAFRGHVDGKCVQVIVRQVDSGMKHVYSVFDCKRPTSLNSTQSWRSL